MTSFMQNKPNFRKAKMNISSALTKDYENILPISTMKKQTQSNPISRQKNAVAQAIRTPAIVRERLPR